ncbi:MAG: oligosaccharide flippase family protein [Actinomycetia bacterium]|nr:oligosaccharide flippase family protein [Actinomycetes bacterium]
MQKSAIIEIGKDSAWYVSAAVATALVGFLAIPILTRIFSPGEYGVFSLVNTAIILVSPIFHSYMSSAIIRFYPEYEIKGQLDVFYSTVFHYFPHFLVLFLGIVLPVTALFIPLGNYRLLISIAIAIFPLFVLFDVLKSLLRARQMSWQFSLLTVFVQFGRYIVGAALAEWGHQGVKGPFWGWLGALLIAVPLEFIMLSACKKIHWKTNSTKLQKEFFRFGFYLVFGTFLSEILIAADRYMVQIFKGSYQVGLYSVTYTLVQSLEMIMISFIMLAAFPVIMKVYETEGEVPTITLISKITRYFIVLLVPIVFGLYVMREPVMRVVTTSKYLPATSIFLPLLGGILLMNLAWIPSLAFYIRKRTKIILLPLGVAAGANIVLNLLMIPWIGYRGAAWATLISYLLYFIIITAVSTRYLHWDFPWFSSIRIVAAGGIMAAGVWAIMQTGISGLGGLIVLAASGAAIYFLALIVLGEHTKAEREFVVEMLSRLPALRRIIQRRSRKKEED